MLSWKQAGHRPHPLVLDHSLSFPICKVWMEREASKLEGPDLSVQVWGPGLSPWPLALGTCVLTWGVQGGRGSLNIHAWMPPQRQTGHPPAAPMLTLSALGAGESLVVMFAGELSLNCL